jgi:hypothetical protein
MLKYADIWWRMVAYGGVWVQVDKGAKALVVLWRMLTYGGVWVQVDEGGEAERLGLGRSTFKSSMRCRQSFAAEEEVNT